MAARFGLQNVRPLRFKGSTSDYKLVTFVPKADLMAVSDAVFAAGGGVLGGYEQCSFHSPGQGGDRLYMRGGKCQSRGDAIAEQLRYKKRSCLRTIIMGYKAFFLWKCVVF